MWREERIYSLIFFFHLLQQCGGDAHSFSAYFISSQGLDLPEYMERVAVDDVTLFSYNSSMKKEVPCPEWLNTTAGQQQWKDINLVAVYNRYQMAGALQSAMLQFNQTGFLLEANVYQGFSRCDLYPNETRRAMLVHAFNGKDFLAYDFDRKTITACVPQAVKYKAQREGDPVLVEATMSFYKSTCYERLDMFLHDAPQLLRKKVPEVRLFQRTEAGSAVLTCHVTGFYPRQVQVEWVGAGLQPMEEEMIGVLPNGDGTYQTRRSVIRPERNPYSCVVHHSSVVGNISRTWVPEGRPALALGISLACIVLAVTGTGLVLRRLCRAKDAVI